MLDDDEKSPVRRADWKSPLSQTDRAASMVDDYDEQRERTVAAWNAQNGQQSGDPATLAQRLLAVANEEPPRRRFIAGADSVASTEQKVADLQADIEVNRERFVSLDLGD